MLAADSRVIVHLSDLHFGREDRHVVHGLRDAVWALSPNVVAVSGDLTQRARRRQFLRARAFVDSLPAPHLIVPGNHDVPLFNIVARFADPLGGYTTHITPDLQPILVEGPVWIAGINTTRPGKWKSGRVDAPTLARLRASLAEAPAQCTRILVAHHPFDATHGSPDASGTLSALTAAGIDVFLTGHLHASYTGHTAHRYNAGGRTAVVVEAGTATSTRVRAEANGFNVLRVGSDTVEVEMHTWHGGRFAIQSAQQFGRTAEGWAALGG